MSRFLFPEWTETLKKWIGILALGAPVYIVVLGYALTNPETLRIGYQPEQPVPYSHAVHVGDLGLDCEYCHNTVTESSHAAIPPAETCMTCHTGLKVGSEKLLPVREAAAGIKPIKWVRVHDLPDYVFFDHSAHVTRGVGCESCHGRVDQMEVVYQAKALTMSWCLDCHRDPDKHIRPAELVTKMGYDYEKNKTKSLELQKQNHINPPTDCSTCHR